MLLAVACAMQTAFTACSKDDGPANEVPQVSEEERIALKAKKFVYDYTKEAYLWEAHIPGTVDYRTAAGPEELFEQMRYKALDKWSYVSEQSDEVMDGFHGVSTTYGYSLIFGRFTNTNNLFAVVEFVYADSPAAKAGIKRGDFILQFNGQNLTESNYKNLYYSPKADLGMGVIQGDNTLALSETKSLVAVKMYEDPVVEAKVLDVDGKKIAYLFYAGYYAESHDKLVKVFQEFEQQGATDLILDLRYNPGGNADTPPFLASLIAPAQYVKQGSLFLAQSWNALYNAYFAQQGLDMNVYFHKDIPVNLNLNTVYVLTTSSTASASEATISGLTPYMDVVKIGSSTHGKYCGAALLTATDANGNPDPEIENWLLSLVVYKFVNKDGFTEFKGGIAPDLEVEDDGLMAGIPLGDPSDPMIAKAISLITGTETKAALPHTFAKDIEMLPQMSERPFRGGYTTIGVNIF